MLFRVIPPLFTNNPGVLILGMELSMSFLGEARQAGREPLSEKNVGLSLKVLAPCSHEPPTNMTIFWLSGHLLHDPGVLRCPFLSFYPFKDMQNPKCPFKSF